MLELSRAMAYKNALAGLDHGGGKAVIIGDPAVDKSEELLLAYGRFLDGPRRALRHRLRRRHLRRGHGRRGAGHPVRDRAVPENGGAGDSSVLTAYGVFQGMRAGAEHLWGAPDAGRPDRRHRRGRQGRPAPGRRTWSRTAPPWWSPTSRRRRSTRYAPAHPEVEVVDDTEALVRADLDVYSPCALGHALTDEVVAVLSARLVCGGANNQLAHPGVEDLLADRGILYAPDYCVNAGGVIQVADELHGFSFERARAKTGRDLRHHRPGARDRPPRRGSRRRTAADRLAERRMAGRPSCAAIRPGRRSGHWDGRNTRGHVPLGLRRAH